MSILDLIKRAFWPATGSANFREFYRNYLAAPDAELVRNGLNEDVIALLTPEERNEAERLLLAQLWVGDDSRTATALGLLGSKKAVARLRKLMNKQTNESFASPAYALALWRIEQDPQTFDAIVAIARNARLQSTARIGAVFALSEMPSARAREALLNILQTEPEYLLRYHSFNVLLMLHGYSWIEAQDQTGEIAPQISGAMENPEAGRAVMARLAELTAGRAPADGT